MLADMHIAHIVTLKGKASAYRVLRSGQFTKLARNIADMLRDAGGAASRPDEPDAERVEAVLRQFRVVEAAMKFCFSLDYVGNLQLDDLPGFSSPIQVLPGDPTFAQALETSLQRHREQGVVADMIAAFPGTVVTEDEVLLPRELYQQLALAASNTDWSLCDLLDAFNVAVGVAGDLYADFPDVERFWVAVSSRAIHVLQTLPRRASQSPGSVLEDVFLGLVPVPSRAMELLQALPPAGSLTGTSLAMLGSALLPHVLIEQVSLNRLLGEVWAHKPTHPTAGCRPHEGSGRNPSDDDDNTGPDDDDQGGPPGGGPGEGKHATPSIAGSAATTTTTTTTSTSTTSGKPRGHSGHLRTAAKVRVSAGGGALRTPVVQHGAVAWQSAKRGLARRRVKARQRQLASTRRPVTNGVSHMAPSRRKKLARSMGLSRPVRRVRPRRPKQPKVPSTLLPISTPDGGASDEAEEWRPPARGRLDAAGRSTLRRSPRLAKLPTTATLRDLPDESPGPAPVDERVFRARDAVYLQQVVQRVDSDDDESCYIEGLTMAKPCGVEHLVTEFDVRYPYHEQRDLCFPVPVYDYNCGQQTVSNLAADFRCVPADESARRPQHASASLCAGLFPSHVSPSTCIKLTVAVVVYPLKPGKPRLVQLRVAATAKQVALEYSYHKFVVELGALSAEDRAQARDEILDMFDRLGTPAEKAQLFGSDADIQRSESAWARQRHRPLQRWEVVSADWLSVTA